MPAKRRWKDILAWLALAALILATAAHLLTRPPTMPAYETVRAGWKPSEAWLYDRDGRLLDSERVDFERRRLAWVPLKDISPAVRNPVVAAEDHRFWSHGGVDWLAIASATKARWTGGRSRGASTLPMQLAAFLAPELAHERVHAEYAVAFRLLARDSPPSHLDGMTDLLPRVLGIALDQVARLLGRGVGEKSDYVSRRTRRLGRIHGPSR